MKSPPPKPARYEFPWPLGKAGVGGSCSFASVTILAIALCVEIVATASLTSPIEKSLRWKEEWLVLEELRELLERLDWSEMSAHLLGVEIW